VRFVDHRLCVCLSMTTTRDLLLRVIKNYQGLARVHTACPIPPLCVGAHASTNKVSCHALTSAKSRQMFLLARERGISSSQPYSDVSWSSDTNCCGPAVSLSRGIALLCSRLKRRAEHKSSRRICEASHPPPQPNLTNITRPFGHSDRSPGSNGGLSPL
jgi:hypothetical protein